MKLAEINTIQITPANGFDAVFANDDATLYTRPLACWGLVHRVVDLKDDEWDHFDDMDLPLPDLLPFERGKPIAFNRVEGMVTSGGRELELCENNEYFLGYIGPGESPLDFQQKARDLIDSFIEDEEDDLEEEEDESLDHMTDSLPQALSHLSVQVQERLRKGTIPPRWEQGGWLEFMRRFGDLSGG
jgi:hypothetical protein